MATVEVELLTDEGNSAVVRLLGRKYPAVLVQGDTLNGLIATTSDAIAALHRGDLANAQELLSELGAKLLDTQSRYEAALHQHGIELPY